MSLKDRLKTTQKPVAAKVQKQQQELRYYESSEDAKQYDSLGIIDSLLFDDDLNNVFVSGAKNVYIEKRGKVHKSTSTFRDNVQLENILRKVAVSQGIEFDEKKPCFQFNHTLGVNALVTLPPLSNCATMFLKCYKDKHATMQTLLEEQSVSKEIALILEALCAIRKNILIIGEKSTLKTTLLSAMAKKLLNNNRAIVIDNQKEFKIDSQNHTNYDFCGFKDEQIKKTLLDSILLSNPDKIFVNDDTDAILPYLLNKAQGYRGFVSTMCASSPNEAIEKLIQLLVEADSNLTFEKAKAIVLNTVDVVITTKKDDVHRRKIGAISEINLLLDDGFIQDIFNTDYLQHHKSCGIVPEFYEDIKENSLPIGDNIFDENYKHTYQKNPEIDSLNQIAKKGGNIDILKKFKKDLPTPKREENVQHEPQEVHSPEISGDELMKKAQEKFDEIKSNIEIQEKIAEQKEIFSQEININNEQNDNL